MISLRERARRARARVRREPSVTIVVVVEPESEQFLDRAHANLDEQRYPRLQVVEAHAHSGGWQSATNLATSTARGDLIGWMRACDTWEPGALHRMVAASGSADLVTGVVATRGEPEEWLRRSQRAAHEGDRDLAADLVIGNRLIRRRTWAEEFAADDSWLCSSAIARHLAAAEGAVAIREVVTRYAPGHGHAAFGSTPSPWPRLIADLALIGRLDAIFAGTVHDEGWRRHATSHLLLPYLLDAERAEPAAWERLVVFLAQRPASTAPDVEARVLHVLAREDRHDEVIALAQALRRSPGEFPTAVRGRDVVLDWPEVPADVPTRVRALDPRDTGGRGAVVRSRESETGGQIVELHLFVDGVDLADRQVGLVIAGCTVERGSARPPIDRFHAGIEVSVAVPDQRGRLDVRMQVEGVLRDFAVQIPRTVPNPSPLDTDALLTQIGVEGGRVLVEGRFEDLALIDENDREIELVRAGRLGLRTTVFGREQALPVGTYRLRTPHGTPVVHAALERSLPLELRAAHHRVSVLRGPYGGLQVRLAPLLDEGERGPYEQRALQERYRLEESPLDPNTVYFETYAGGSATDSALPIFTELQSRLPHLRLVWGVADDARWTPDGAERVLLRSRRWYDVLARAGTLVLNTDVEPWFVRRPGQFVLQTFHGYPSKGMGRVQWEAKEYPPSRIAQMRARGVDTWSAIVTPTPEMTVHYREQYDYTGPAFEHGYPRDDVLIDKHAGAVRRRTRELLGIEGDQIAVLYAPTWREQLAVRHRRAAWSDHLDVAALAKALGGRYVVLVRGHRFHRPPRVAAAGARVVDVTEYPEINDLILACDAGVLDYSSLRFDMALLRKPLVFLVPDLEAYARGTRQFLFPFEESAPGPLASTTAEVAAHLRDHETLRETYAEAMTEFNRRFHPHQDGRSTARVVDGLLASAPVGSAR